MRHTIETKDHFLKNREEKIDKFSTKNIISHKQYGSHNTKHLTVDELKQIMKKLQWIV
jgi:hypothetical protein